MATPDQQQLQRLRYLQSMGISSWYPREQLPFAAESAVLQWQFVERAAVSPVPATPNSRIAVSARIASDGADSGKAESLRQALTASAPPAGKQSMAQVVPAAARTASKPASQRDATKDVVAVLRFQMLFYQIDEKLALLCHQPALATGMPRKQEQVLLANILHWLGRKLPDPGSPRIFRWPIPGFDQADSSAAGSSMLAFLAQAASEQPYTNLVVMGETLIDALQVSLAPETLSCDLFVTASLTEMLNMPALKKDTWLKLIPLHAALTE